MDGRKQELYVKIFEYMRDIHEIYPHTVMCDFEKGMKNAGKRVWKNCTIRGCLFHFQQAILRKAKSFPEIASSLNKSINVRYAVRMFGKIPLLPSNKLEDGLLEVFQFQKSHKLAKMFKGFNKYYMRQWAKLSFCSDDLDMLTNNYCESFNAKLKRLIHKNPSTFMFLSKL